MNPLESLRKKALAALEKIAPGHPNNTLRTDSFIGDLIAAQSVPGPTSTSGIERLNNEDGKALEALLDFENIPKEMVTFYQKKDRRPEQTEDEPEIG